MPPGQNNFRTFTPNDALVNANKQLFTNFPSAIPESQAINNKNSFIQATRSRADNNELLNAQKT